VAQCKSEAISSGSRVKPWCSRGDGLPLFLTISIRLLVNDIDGVEQFPDWFRKKYEDGDEILSDPENERNKLLLLRQKRFYCLREFGKLIKAVQTSPHIPLPKLVQSLENCENKLNF